MWWERPPRNFPRRPCMNLTKLKLHAHVRLKELILIKRIDLDIAQAASPKAAIDAPRVSPCEVKANGIREHVSAFHGYAFLVKTAIEDIRIDQVGIQRILFGVLIPGPELPITPLLYLANSPTDLPGVMLAGVRFKPPQLCGRLCAIGTLDVASRPTEDAHWSPP